MKLIHFFGLLSLPALILSAAFLPGAAQDAPSILILPVDQANFLPGALFDLRIEVHSNAVTDDPQVTVNGVPAAEFFGVEPIREEWENTDDDVMVRSVIWRGVPAPAPGDYAIEASSGGTTEQVIWTVRQPTPSLGARNVILFIADGMTIPMITAARIASRGITAGRLGGTFHMDTLDEIGLAHTTSLDSLMADSSNTASAINTGHLANIGSTGVYMDSSPDRLDDPRVETFAEMIKRRRGMSVGVVTTADLSDSTPAAVWAHGRDRSNLSRNTYLVQALESGVVDVLMGGGGRRFIPQSVEDSDRTDERDLFAEYAAAGFTIVTTRTELLAAVPGSPQKLLGVFRPGDLNTWLDRNVFVENLEEYTDQPGLVDMTLGALELLRDNPNGFYLEVEAAHVDKQMHRLDQERSLSEVIEFDFAVGAAIEWAAQNAPDTLIIVTADHGHGYDVFGTVNVGMFNAATDDMGRRNAIRTSRDAEFPTYSDPDGDGFPDWYTDIVFAGTVNNSPNHTEDFQLGPRVRVPAIPDADGNYRDNPEDDPGGIYQLGNLPMRSDSGVHTLQDVPVFAGGPGADSFGGVYHQLEIFFAMAAAIGLDPSQPDGIAR